MSHADEADDHSHHLPAVDDWPQGFGEASWWPFVTALGAAGFYIGAALYVLSTGESPIVPTLYGPAVFIGSAFVFLTGLYGWVYHAFVKSFWDGEGHGTGLRFGMLAFLGSEIATFGAGFVYYFFIRSDAWTNLPPLVESGHIFSSLVIANTVILVISSITLHYAHVALINGDHSRFKGLLGVTLLLGFIFLGGQVYEYYEFIVHENFTIFGGAYASAFYGLTGLHGLHVTLGAVLLSIVFVRALYGQYSAEKHTSVSTVSMYWHFVDVVWVFLVVVLYAGAVINL
ncbi:cytochrome c oxidase subunit 3 [Halorarius halobius]|uniref:cytochrome c oxidase subunit 3 n=1 Tax=Halorarius halobius TaxID=2962671 RepID=UPI0020CFAFED|nr:heme-copper oxidase subunit III [Halorarius halobius]